GRRRESETTDNAIPNHGDLWPLDLRANQPTQRLRRHPLLFVEVREHGPGGLSGVLRRPRQYSRHTNRAALVYLGFVIRREPPSPFVVARLRRFAPTV